MPFDLFDIDIFSASENELREMSSELGLNLSLDEMHHVRSYFKKLDRSPTDVEVQSIAQAWSEHCCYKSSKVFLREHVFNIKHDDVLSKGDAGVMVFDDEYGYALRIESHNHPSAIEPYGGAATGIGGIVRDVLCMGAQPIALVDPLVLRSLGPQRGPSQRGQVARVSHGRRGGRDPRLRQPDRHPHRGRGHLVRPLLHGQLPGERRLRGHSEAQRAGAQRRARDRGCHDPLRRTYRAAMAYTASPSRPPNCTRPPRRSPGARCNWATRSPRSL